MMKAMLADDHSETRDRARGHVQSRGLEVVGGANGHAHGTLLDIDDYVDFRALREKLTAALRAKAEAAQGQ